MKDKKLQDKILGSYLGLAIGDALGGTTEFMTKKEIESEYKVHKNIIGGGWLNLRAGEVTDDTQMSLYLGRSIIRSSGFNTKDVADSFVEWMSSKPKDIGNTVRRGLKLYKRKGILESEYSEYAAGNGACMRNIPVIIYGLNDVSLMEQMSLLQAKITHNNTLSDVALIALSKMTHIALLGGNKLDMLDVIPPLLKEYPMFSHSKYKGECSAYVVDTFKTVIYYFSETDNFEELLIGVTNQGGDADTTGAIAGMLGGALYGFKSIPRRWRWKLDKAVYKEIEEQCQKLTTLNTIII